MNRTAAVIGKDTRIPLGVVWVLGAAVTAFAFWIAGIRSDVSQLRIDLTEMKAQNKIDIAEMKAQFKIELAELRARNFVGGGGSK